MEAVGVRHRAGRRTVNPRPDVIPCSDHEGVVKLIYMKLR